MRLDFFLRTALFFSRRSRRGRVVNRGDSSALIPPSSCLSYSVPLSYSAIFQRPPFFLLRLQTPLNSIFPTPFYFSAASSFFFFPPVIFFSSGYSFNPPPSPYPALSPSVFSVCSFTVGPTTEPPRLRLDSTSQLTLAGRHTRSPGKIRCFSMLKCQALNKPLWGSKVQWSRPPRTDPVKYPREWK